jgi:hypothetical protein
MAGILDRFIKTEIQRKSPEAVAYEDGVMAGKASSYPGGQPPKPIALSPQVPSLDRETMELYLKVRTPSEIDTLKGHKRFWIYTDNEAAVEVPTSNMNQGSQRTLMENLTTAIDFIGCDNVDFLIQDQMLKDHARILTNKARSDYGDGIRERVVPSIGIGMAGSYGPKIADEGERPRETKLIGNLGR